MQPGNVLTPSPFILGPPARFDKTRSPSDNSGIVNESMSSETNSPLWEQRWHPLREEWVIVAAHRQERPWQGETVKVPSHQVPPFDPDCHFCPGNMRISGISNPTYEDVLVFDNDHPCVGPDCPTALDAPAGVHRNRPAQGLARVICYSPRHNTTLAELDQAAIERLMRTWQDQYRELSGHGDIQHVLVFENKGEAVGVSNPHPHCQVYATNFVVKIIETEVNATQKHLRHTGRVLFEDVLDAEVKDGSRIVCQRDSAIAFVPYFGRYAYETFVAPKQAHASIADLASGELSDLAAVLRETLIRFDNLWQMSFPYVMALHQAPTDGQPHDGFHFHIEFHPPLRKPTVMKYLAGAEVGGGCFLTDTAPEAKAAELRGVSGVHYKSD